MTMTHFSVPCRIKGHITGTTESYNMQNDTFLQKFSIISDTRMVYGHCRQYFCPVFSVPFFFILGYVFGGFSHVGGVLFQYSNRQMSEQNSQYGFISRPHSLQALGLIGSLILNQIGPRLSDLLPLVRPYPCRLCCPR